jgi:hypothetical protein
MRLTERERGVALQRSGLKERAAGVRCYYGEVILRVRQPGRHYAAHTGQRSSSTASSAQPTLHTTLYSTCVIFVDLIVDSWIQLVWPYSKEKRTRFLESVVRP